MIGDFDATHKLLDRLEHKMGAVGWLSRRFNWGIECRKRLFGGYCGCRKISMPETLNNQYKVQEVVGSYDRRSNYR